jgi:hypothetical protein
MIPRYRPLGQTGGNSDQLPNKNRHSQVIQPCEGAPLLRQVRRQLIASNAPITNNSQQSVEQPLSHTSTAANMLEP